MRWKQYKLLRASVDDKGNVNIPGKAVPVGMTTDPGTLRPVLVLMLPHNEWVSEFPDQAAEEEKARAGEAKKAEGL